MEFHDFEKIMKIPDDLLDFEYKFLEHENLINLFEFQKLKYDFMQIKDVLENNPNKSCYAIPNIFYNAKYFVDESKVNYI